MQAISELTHARPPKTEIKKLREKMHLHQQPQLCVRHAPTLTSILISPLVAAHWSLR